jgi:hypothetical protein
MLISNVPMHPTVRALMHFTLRSPFRSRLSPTRKPNCSLSTAISDVDFNFASFCKPCRRLRRTRSTFQHGIIYCRIVPMHVGYNISNLQCFTTSNFIPKYRKPTAVLRVHSATVATVRSRFHVIAASVLSIQTPFHLFHINVGRTTVLLHYSSSIRFISFLDSIARHRGRAGGRSSERDGNLPVIRIYAAVQCAQHPRHFVNVIPVPYVYVYRTIPVQ